MWYLGIQGQWCAMWDNLIIQKVSTVLKFFSFELGLVVSFGFVVEYGALQELFAYQDFMFM